MSISCTDEEFIAAWKRFGNAKDVAKFFNIAQRNAFARRRSLERKYALPLESKVKHPYINYDPRLPKQRAEERISDGYIVIFSDCHYWPGNPSLAHLALLRLLKKLGNKVVIIVANGDIIDGATTSRHHRLGWEKRPTLASELDAARTRLDEVKRAAPHARRYWNIGNHDNRLDGWLANHTPEVEGLHGTCLQDQFLDWPMSLSLHVNQNTSSHTVIKHRYKGGMYAVRNNTLNMGTHCVTSHLHQCRVWAHDDYRGTKWSVDTGCLAEPYGDQFLYVEDNPRDWRSGFAILRYCEGFLYPPQLCIIQEGRAIYCNEEI